MCVIRWFNYLELIKEPHATLQQALLNLHERISHLDMMGFTLTFLKEMELENHH